MARIEFIDLAHSYDVPRRTGDKGDDRSAPSFALRPMSVTWNDGGAYALLGPSGCGKTTLLNIISGLVSPTQGQVLFDGRDVTHLAPQDRNIAQVFQFPVIYDTMTVFDNLAFPLRNRGWQSTQINRRVHEVAELLELTADLQRRARGLPADAKQKISLGRGLVRPDVAAILFDEPLTVIDPHLKWLLRRKLKQIHQQLKLSLIYVTHDQIEALTFADTVIVMMQGEIVQSGSAQDLFETPSHTFVGHFIGSPGMNFFPCTLLEDSAVVDDLHFDVEPGVVARAKARNGALKLGIRPEFVECFATPAPDAHPITVQSVLPMGACTQIAGTLGRHDICIKPAGTFKVDNAKMWIRFPQARLMLYANETRVQ